RRSRARAALDSRFRCAAARREADRHATAFRAGRRATCRGETNGDDRQIGAARSASGRARAGSVRRARYARTHHAERKRGENRDRILLARGAARARRSAHGTRLPFLTTRQIRAKTTRFWVVGIGSSSSKGSPPWRSSAKRLGIETIASTRKKFALRSKSLHG